MIDGGLRPSRPAGRPVAYRSESVRHQPEGQAPMEQQMMPESQPQKTQQYRRPEAEQLPPRQPRNLSWVKWVVIVLLLAAVGVLGRLFMKPSDQGIAATIDESKYQAVFLSNGQVYFGRLSVVNSEFMKLTNVFYLERQLTASTDTDTDTNQPPTSSDNNFQLLKYSDVLYGSEDAMMISRDDIIRFENLRTDGVVAKAIANRR